MSAISAVLDVQDVQDVMPARRLLLVHAHPDDESISTGVTMARYAAEGAHVTLVSCTQGEQGEILVPELTHLAADQQDSLGPHRAGELAQAMAELGVTDYRFLGGPGRYRDSGMVWGDEGRRAVAPEKVRPDSFWAADLLEAADHLVQVIREIRPQVVVTYDETGGYGHPDHIQAHRVTTYATALAAVPSYRADLGLSWAVAKGYWAAFPRSVMRHAIELMRERGDAVDDPESPESVESIEDFGFVVPDADISTMVDGTDYVEAKMAALRAYVTQIDLDGSFFAVPDHTGLPVWRTEYFRLVHGVAGPVDQTTNYETDLFAGLGI